MRFLSLLAALAAAATFGLATPAEASATDPFKVSTVTKCGYLEITIESSIVTTADFSFYAGAGGANNVPVKAGTNVYKLYAKDLSSGLIDIQFGDGGNKYEMYYRQPEGCKVPKLAFEYGHACGGKVLVRVTNTGDVPAEDIFVYRNNGATYPSVPQRELAVGGLTFPVGTSYVLVDKMSGDLRNIEFNRDIMAGSYWADRPNLVGYQQPQGCAEAPQVSVVASCTGGVDITSTPADAELTTHVFGQSDSERTGTARHVDMAKGEALGVEFNEIPLGAFVYQGVPSSCNPPPPSTSASPTPALAVTGGRTALPLAVGSGLLLMGALVLLFVRRRARTIG